MSIADIDLHHGWAYPCDGCGDSVGVSVQKIAIIRFGMKNLLSTGICTGRARKKIEVVHKSPRPPVSGRWQVDASITGKDSMREHAWRVDAMLFIRGHCLLVAQHLSIVARRMLASLVLDVSAILLARCQSSVIEWRLLLVPFPA